MMRWREEPWSMSIKREWWGRWRLRTHSHSRRCRRRRGRLEEYLWRSRQVLMLHRLKGKGRRGRKWWSLSSFRPLRTFQRNRNKRPKCQPASIVGGLMRWTIQTDKGCRDNRQGRRMHDSCRCIRRLRLLVRFGLVGGLDTKQNSSSMVPT